MGSTEQLVCATFRSSGIPEQHEILRTQLKLNWILGCPFSSPPLLEVKLRSFAHYTYQLSQQSLSNLIAGILSDSSIAEVQSSCEVQLSKQQIWSDTVYQQTTTLTALSKPLIETKSEYS